MNVEEALRQKLRTSQEKLRAIKNIINGKSQPEDSRGNSCTRFSRNRSHASWFYK